MDAKELARSVNDYVVQYRRIVHQNPELSMEEFKTTDRICGELDKMGISYKRMKPTGVLAEIRGGKGEGKTVLLRGDIDGLPVKEDTGLPFASTNGCMHACGHDMHNAMLLGAVKAIHSIRDQFAGTVKFIFQPAEEAGTGAKAMIEQGVLEGVDYMYGEHMDSTLEPGAIASVEGPFEASAFWFTIDITGHQAHGADPGHGVDAAVAGSAVVMGLQDMVAREYDPFEPMVVTVGDIKSPGRFNIIPGTYHMEGTIRTFSRDINNTLGDTLNRIANGIAGAYRCKASVSIHMVADVNQNDHDAFQIGRAAAEKVGKFVTAKKEMGGEDFSFYTPYVKSGFFKIGGRMPDKDGNIYSHHTPKVMFDEKALMTGVAFFIQVAMDTLEKG
jgi:amidohydrolase